MNLPERIEIWVQPDPSKDVKQQRREALRRGETVTLSVPKPVKRIYFFEELPSNDFGYAYKLTNDTDEGYVYGEISKDLMRQSAQEVAKTFSRECAASIQSDLYRSGLRWVDEEAPYGEFEINGKERT